MSDGEQDPDVDWLGGGLGGHTGGKKVPEVPASEDFGLTPVRRFSPSYVKPIPHEGFTK